MPGLILLASGLLIPLFALVLIQYGQENIPLMLRLLASAGILCGVLAWIFRLGAANPVDNGNVIGVNITPGLSNYEIFVSVADTCSLIASALVSAAWILALVQTVRDRNSRWISALVASGVIAYLARVIYQYPGLVIPLASRLNTPDFLGMGLYALGLLGGLAALIYGTRPPAPSGLFQDAEGALDEEAMSSITREPL